MKLSEIQRGNVVMIESIPDEHIRAQAYRFGIAEGATVRCLESLRRGPVVLEKNYQEIALGRFLAERITVILSDTPKAGQIMPLNTTSVNPSPSAGIPGKVQHN